MKFFDKRYLRESNKIAIPIIFSNISCSLLGLVDQAIVGRISIYAYAGIGLVASTIYSLVGVLGNISVAYNILGAKSKGAEDKNDISEKFNITMMINIFIGIICFLFMNIFCNTILNTFFGLDGQALKEASDYLKVFSLTIGLNLILFTFSALFKIYKTTNNIFVVSIIINIINVALDYILVFGKFGFKEMGSMGAAVGSVVSLMINVIIYYMLSRKNISINFKISSFKEKCNKLLKLSLPLVGQEAFQELFFIVCINMIISRIGVIELSTYTLILNIINLLLMPAFAYASTNMTLVSEQIGKNNFEDCRNITHTCLATTILIFIVSFVIIGIFKNSIPKLITSDSELILNSNQYIILAVGIQIFFIFQTMYKFSLQSINCEKWVFKYSLIINVFTMILIAVLAISFRLYGVYIALFVNYITLTILFNKKYEEIIEYKVDLCQYSRHIFLVF